MQLHVQISRVKRAYAAAPIRSHRKVQKHREHVFLMLKQLKREIRREKRK